MSRHPGFLVFAIALLVYASTTGGSLTSSDAVVSYELTRSLVHERSFAIPSDVLGGTAHVGRDGRSYSPFGIGHSIYSIPFYVAGLAAQSATGIRTGKTDTIGKGAVVFGSAVAAALAVWLTFLFGLRLGGSLRAATAAALVTAFGTLLWPYAKFGFSAPIVCACLTGAIYNVWTGTRSHDPRRFLLSGACVGCALLTRHEMVLATIPILAGLFMANAGEAGRTGLRARLRHAMLLLVPVGIALVLWLAYNYVRFGNPLDTGYLRDESVAAGSLVTGFFGFLFSPGASIFLYSPVTIVGVLALGELWRRDRATCVFLAGPILTFLLFYSAFEHWSGGRSYGPRYLVVVLPCLVLPLVFWFRDLGTRRHRLLWALCATSVLIQLPGVLVDYSKVSIEQARAAGTALPDRINTWEGAPLRANIEATIEAVPRNVRYVLGLESPPAVDRTADAGRRDFAQQFAFSLDLWWLYLRYLGAIGTPLAVALGLAPLAIAAWLGLILRRQGQIAASGERQATV